MRYKNIFGKLPGIQKSPPLGMVIPMTKTQKKSLLSFTFILSATILLFTPLLSHADEETIDILPPVTHSGDTAYMPDDSTHPTVRLTPDKSELIRLEKKAGSIIIGNPAHINVIADSADTLVIIPKTPGATHFTVLDKHGQTLMQRHVIVASPKQDYVKVKRVCREDSKECQNTSVFYCPDTCHEIGLTNQDSSSDDSAEDENGKAGSNSRSSNGKTEKSE